jgi:glycosyltransferase involved in cell wall biosynthesis
VTASWPSRRILLVIPTLGAGGAEVQTSHLAAGLAARGDKVTLALQRVAVTDAEPLRQAGVHVIELGAMTRPAKAAELPRLIRLARAADVVHCTLFDASFYGRVAAFITGRPVTVGEHSADRAMQVSSTGAPRASLIGLHHRLLAPFTFATVACASAQIALLRREGVPASRLALVPNGVPVAAIRTAAAAGSVTRGELGIPEDARLIIQVGRLTPEKNQRATVDAVAALRERLGDVHVLFAGSGADESAPRRADELGATWAHFAGSRPDVAALLGLAELAVMPSIIDTFPMAAIEAMAAGLPQVTSDVGDLATIVAGTGSGISLPAGDQDAFEGAMARLLSDEAERARLAARAAESAWEFDVGHMVERYSEIFDAALAGQPLPAAFRAPELSLATAG